MRFAMAVQQNSLLDQLLFENLHGSWGYQVLLSGIVTNTIGCLSFIISQTSKRFLFRLRPCCTNVVSVRMMMVALMGAKKSWVG